MLSDSLTFTCRYDQQVNHWLAVFPLHTLCIVSQPLLLTNQSRIMGTVGGFIGLSTIDWSAVVIDGITQSEHGPVADSLDYDVDGGTLTRLRSFFEKHGMRYWETVREQGHVGCQKSVVAD